MGRLMTRTRIGLAVAHGAVRAVAVRDGRVIWAGDEPAQAPEQLQEAITSLLARIPTSVRRWPRPLVAAAIGPHHAQVKRVSGLPDTADAATLAAIVRENTGAFFLKNGVPLITTSVRPAGPGSAFAAALDVSCVEIIRAACRTAAFPLGPIVPSAIALLGALEGGVFHWNDGTLTLEVTRNGHGLESIRTRARAGDDASVAAAPTPVPALTALGSDGLRYADAFGAARAAADEPLALQPQRTGVARLVRSGRANTILGLLALGVLAVALSPLGAYWAGRQSVARMAEIRPGRWQVITTTLAQLDRVSAVLRETHDFAESRPRLGELLGDLARALPAGSAIVSFEWSDGSAEVVLLTRNTAAVLAALKRVPGIRAAELSGNVVRQAAGGQELHRITIRLTTS
jgi:hypothetical protein